LIGQIHRCNIYTSSDDYKTPVYVNVKCRFTHNTLNTQLQTLTQRERAALLAGRRLQYPSYVDMPDNARVEWVADPTAEGYNSMWNVVEETESAWHGPGGKVTVNTCQLEKVGTLY
jgi:hypothetical protein